MCLGIFTAIGIQCSDTSTKKYKGGFSGAARGVHKKITGALRIAQAAYPDKECALWIQDEGRFGLKPILKRQWALRGQRPIIEQTRKYQWLYAYIFVEPDTGRSEYFLLPTVNLAWMEAALESFAAAVDPENQKIILLVLDQAGWHMSKKLKVPNNILLMPLPPYTPELSPAEPMVNKLKIPLANKTLQTLQEVEDLLSEECIRLKENRAEVRSLTRFPWIQNVLESS